MELDWTVLNAQELNFRLLNYLFIEKRNKAQNKLSEERIEGLKKNLNLWQEENIAAAIASGSYRVGGMIISPCSMGTLAHIAMGTSQT